MKRRRYRSRIISGPMGAVLVAGILVAGPLTAPAAAWSESANPAPSPTTGFINFHLEGASWHITGGDLKVSPFVPPRPPKGSPVPTGGIGQEATVTIYLEKKTGVTKPSVVDRRTQVVHLLADKPTVTVKPGTFGVDKVDLFENYRISYKVTWRWLTGPRIKPLPDPLRTVRVTPTDEADATCITFDLGTCTVDDQGWIRFGTTFSD